MSFSFLGYIRVKLSGERVADFVNLCRREGIILYDIKKIMNVYYVNIKGKHYKSLLHRAEEFGIKTEINGRLGLLMKLVLYKSRRVFFIILILLSLYYGVNSFFISEIVINGNNLYTDSQIMHCLKNNGLYEGRVKFGINPEFFQNEVIKDFSGISWIWVRIDGTKAIVDVREKISKPQFYDYSKHCNIVASKDGVITSAVSSAGTTLVSEGMYVRKGDILISGVYDSTDFAPARFINADGVVYARTTYSIEDDYNYNYISYKVTNPPKTFISASLFDIGLWEDTDTSSSVVIDRDNIKFHLFGKNYLPLAFTKTKYCEIIKTEYTLSESEAQSFAIKELTARLNLSLPDGVVVTNTKKNITPNPDGTFKATVSYECIEDIATEAPIEVE